MVKILASGEIVPDDDPRARGAAGGSRQTETRHRRQGGIDQFENQDPVQHQPEGNVFEGLNSRLLNLGVPRWNVGSYVVEPIVSLGFLLAFIFLGFPGLLFAAILFILSQATLGGGGRGWQGGGARQDEQGTDQDGGGGNYQPPRGPGGGGGGGGYRLGHS